MCRYTDLLLYDRASTDVTKVARLLSDSYIANGTLGERYATWSTCRMTCRAFVYDAMTDTKSTVPTRNDRPQYSPTVDEAHGTLFFIRSGFACGAQVIFFSLPVESLGSTPTKIAELPDGVDADMASLDGSDLIFSRIVCDKNVGIYELGNVAT